MRTLNILTGLIIILSLSCKKESKDVSGPTVIISDPAQNSKQYAGGTIDMNVNCQDDNELSSLVISVKAAYSSLLNPFSFSETYSISGKSTTMMPKISISNDASSGDYILTAYAQDKEGNKSAVIEKNISIVDSIRPIISKTGILIPLQDTIVFKASYNSKNILDKVIISKKSGELIATINDNSSIKSLVMTMIENAKSIGASYSFNPSSSNLEYKMKTDYLTGKNNWLSVVIQDATNNYTNGSLTAEN